jgi:hypothetical protein
VGLLSSIQMVFRFGAGRANVDRMINETRQLGSYLISPPSRRCLSTHEVRDQE